MLTAPFLASDGLGPQFLLGLAVLAGLWTLIKGVPKVTGGIARVDTAARQIIGDDDHKGIAERVGDIEREMKPNGGASFRDEMRQVKASVLRVEELAKGAKSTAEDVAGRLQVAEREAVAERVQRAADYREVLGRVDVLMNALDQYAQERWAKDEYAQIREAAYIRALKAFGLDLTSVAEALEGGPDAPEP